MSKNDSKKTPNKMYFYIFFGSVLLGLIFIFGPSFFDFNKSKNNELVNNITQETDSRLIGLYINSEYIGYDERFHEFENASYEYYVEYEIKPGDKIEYYHGEKNVQHFWVDKFENEFINNLKVVDIYENAYSVGSKNNHIANDFKGVARLKTSKPLRAAIAITLN